MINGMQNLIRATIENKAKIKEGNEIKKAELLFCGSSSLDYDLRRKNSFKLFKENENY